MMNCSIAVLGNGISGKSAMVTQLTKEYFLTEHEPIDSINCYNYLIPLNKNQKIQLKIYDTSGSNFSEERLSCIRESDGFIITYSIRDPDSFKCVESICSDIASEKQRENNPIIICANMSDFEDQRKVSKAEGQELASRLGVPFYETSALCNFHIKEPFIKLAEMILGLSIKVSAPPKQKKHSKKHSKKHFCQIF